VPARWRRPAPLWRRHPSEDDRVGGHGHPEARSVREPTARRPARLAASTGWPARQGACAWRVAGLSGGQAEVLLIGRNAGVQRVGPADALQPGRDLGVIQVGVVAALRADKFKCAGVAPSIRPSTMRSGWRRRLAVLPWPGWPARGLVTGPSVSMRSQRSRETCGPRGAGTAAGWPADGLPVAVSGSWLLTQPTPTPVLRYCPRSGAAPVLATARRLGGPSRFSAPPPGSPGCWRTVS
jgi:hypothetical protein